MAEHNYKSWAAVPSIQDDKENFAGRQAQKESEENRYGYAEGGSFGRGTLRGPSQVERPTRPFKIDVAPVIE
jgi:hypothetical protein